MYEVEFEYRERQSQGSWKADHCVVADIEKFENEYLQTRNCAINIITVIKHA